MKLDAVQILSLKLKLPTAMRAKVDIRIIQKAQLLVGDPESVMKRIVNELTLEIQELKRENRKRKAEDQVTCIYPFVYPRIFSFFSHQHVQVEEEKESKRLAIETVVEGLD